MDKAWTQEELMEEFEGSPAAAAGGGGGGETNAWRMSKLSSPQAVV